MEEIKEMRKEIDELLDRVCLLVDKIKELEAVNNDEIKEGDKYFHINGAGFIYSFIAGDNPESDGNFKKLGNMFKTQDDAEFMVKRLEVLAKMKKFEEPDDRPWDGNTKHYYLSFNVDFGTIEYGSLWLTKYNDICFESMEMAKRCVEAVGKEDLIKYYFKVKE